MRKDLHPAEVQLRAKGHREAGEHSHSIVDPGEGQENRSQRLVDRDFGQRGVEIAEGQVESFGWDCWDQAARLALRHDT